MKPKDQLIKEIKGLEGTTPRKLLGLGKTKKESLNTELIIKDITISAINIFLKDYKLVKKGDLFTKDEIEIILHSSLCNKPMFTWQENIIKKLKSLRRSR